MTSKAAPADPPIPVPDVPGADATARGLPRRVDLTLRQRLIVDSSAVADLGLAHHDRFDRRCRDAAALARAALRPSESRAERDAPAVLRRTGRRAGSGTVLPGAHIGRRGSPRAPANPVAEWIATGQRAQHPVRQQLRGRQPGAARPVPRVRAQQRGARPALAPRRRPAPHAVPDPRLHGIGVSVQRAVLLAAVVLPVAATTCCSTRCRSTAAAPRSTRHSAVTATSRTGMAGFAEAMAQAVHDFRSVLDYLEFTGVDRIALTGMSLGRLHLRVDRQCRRPDPGGHPERSRRHARNRVDDWFPANNVVALNGHLARTDREESAAAGLYHSPLNYPPLVPKDRRLIIAGLGDRLAPPSRPSCFGNTGTAARFTGSPATTSCTSASPTTCAG